MPSDLHDHRRAQKNMCNFCTGGKRGSLVAMPDSFNSGGKYIRFPTGSFKICKVLAEGPYSVIIRIIS